MNLVFLDRAVAKPAPGESFLTIQPDGNCNLSSGAVKRYQLAEQRWVSLAQDTDTNTFYLVFGAGSPDRKPYSLRANKGKASTRSFSAAAPAKQLLAAFHAAPDAKSLRLAIGAAISHEVGQLFPLSIDGQAVVPAEAPAPVAEAAPIEETAPAVVELTADAPATVPAPEAPTAPKPSLGSLPESRAEQLADYWYEREISKAEPAELTELLKVLGNTPKGDRGFKENVVLGRAKAENARRGKAKKGGNRG